MRIRLAIPDRLVTPEGLEAALEATALANEQAIMHGELPDITDAIRKGGVRWKPEPYLDGEHFDLGEQVMARKWGDCDDLAPWLAGQLRASGEDPGARPRVYKTAPSRWHVVVETSDGRILDPSKWAGMGRKSSVSGVGGDGVAPAIARPFARRNGGALCVMHQDGHWWSRCDLPWDDGSGHLASHARGSTPEAALHRAMAGAISCGEQIDSPLVDRAICAEDLLSAHPDEVGNLFGGLLKGISKVALPMASSFIPGGSIATSALSALTKGGGKGKAPPGTVQHPNGAVSIPLEHAAPEGHDQHMMLSYYPAHAQGPVVMRF